MPVFPKFATLPPALKAVLLMLTAVFLISLMNAFAKLASDYHTPLEIVFYRGLFGLMAITIWMSITNNFHLLKTDRPRAHLGRSIIGTISVSLVFWSYSLLPMADASAILLTSSFFVAILSGPLLGERLGPWRWGAIIIGLIGAVIVAQPSGDHFNLLGFVVAMCASFTVGTISIFLRSLGKTEHAVTTVFYFTLFGTMATGVYMIFNGHVPSIYAIIPLIGTAICSLVSLLLKTEAYKYGEASSMAPCHYTSILWSTLLGVIFFGDMPTIYVLIGSIIIIASNGFIIWREQVRKIESQND